MEGGRHADRAGLLSPRCWRCAASPALAQTGPDSRRRTPPAADVCRPSSASPTERKRPAAVRQSAASVADSVPPGRFSFQPRRRRLPASRQRRPGRSRFAARTPPAGPARQCRKTAPRWRRKSAVCKTKSPASRQRACELREPPPPPRRRPICAAASEKPRRRRKIARGHRARPRRLENAWRRLVDMIVNFQKDMMRKS